MITSIACPACQVGTIPIDARLLAAGQSFSCGTCFAVIGVAEKSKDVLANGVNEFSNLKNKLNGMKTKESSVSEA